MLTLKIIFWKNNLHIIKSYTLNIHSYEFNKCIYLDNSINQNVKPFRFWNNEAPSGPVLLQMTLINSGQNRKTQWSEKKWKNNVNQGDCGVQQKVEAMYCKQSTNFPFVWYLGWRQDEVNSMWGNKTQKTHSLFLPDDPKNRIHVTRVTRKWERNTEKVNQREGSTSLM